jgi:hypothetical protein
LSSWFRKCHKWICASQVSWGEFELKFMNCEIWCEVNSVAWLPEPHLKCVHLQNTVESYCPPRYRPKRGFNFNQNTSWGPSLEDLMAPVSAARPPPTKKRKRKRNYFFYFVLYPRTKPTIT